MKIIGLNFGRVKGQNRGSIDRVLAACEAAGAETKRIDAMQYYFGPVQPEDPEIVPQDDFETVLSEILDCDGLVVGCPVYAIQPTGQFKSFVDRIAAKYQMASGAPIRKEPLGPKYISYISLGGARDHHWVSMSMPMMKMLGNVLGCSEIDEMDVNGHPPYPKDLQKMAEAMTSAIQNLDGTYKGSHAGACPVCHADFVTIVSGTDVICPVCGNKGKMIFEGDSVRIVFE